VAARLGDRPDHLVDEPEFEGRATIAQNFDAAFGFPGAWYEAEIARGGFLAGRGRSPAGLLEAFPERAAGGVKILSEIGRSEWQKCWGYFALKVWGQKQ
jgi:hypothetical protein